MDGGEVTDPEHVVEAHLARIQQIEWEIKHETRLDTLRGLLQYVESGNVLDAAALRELIAEVEKATEPIE
jgi:hypothetical protein